MPLLKKKVFEKNRLPGNIGDNEKVFYCVVTNEIFRNYEEFSERMFLCNSMVWTCSITGKTNLTYAEALESEQTAKKSIRGFPLELKIPVLYLANKTKRTAFGDMAEDVFTYAKDRFFIGEHVDTSLNGSKWKKSKILQVVAPTLEQIQNHQNNTNNKNIEEQYPVASLYRYEIENLDSQNCEKMVVDFQHIRRKKGVFSKEKCKIFLRQYSEQDDRGIAIIKQSAISKFKINEVNFKEIFCGNPPTFTSSKKFDKAVNGIITKKVKQGSLDKFLTKNGNNGTSNANANLLEKIKKREEEMRLKKQQKKEEELAMKQKKKEEKQIVAIQLKDWFKPKEDLELLDHKKLPIATPVRTKIPDEYFGDVLMVLEFVNAFSKLLQTKKFFPNGLTIELMERALLENEVAGPLIDVIQMFLNALFSVQEEEASQYRTQIENISNIKQEEDSNNMNVREAMRQATIASAWSSQYQGLPLGRLPLYSLTTSEILRLHLLSSGAIINYTGAKWRYQQRGGYLSEDDPGLHLRLHNPNILKSLKRHNVVQLPIGDKLTILSCLINQLLTYADVRDIVEERMEKTKQTKLDYKMALASERKQHQEILAAKRALNKNETTNGVDLAEKLKKLEMEAESKKGEIERKLEEFTNSSQENQIILGRDRAYRQYLKIMSVPGLFVNAEEENIGVCLSHIVKQEPSLIDASMEEILVFLNKMFPDEGNSPTKNHQKINGTRNELNQSLIDSCHELMICTADSATCTIHTKDNSSNKWFFYCDVEKFNELLNSLNKRGIRESKLQHNLKCYRQEIEQIIGGTPKHILNKDMSINGIDEADLKSTKKSSNEKYDDANLGYPTSMQVDDVLQNALVEIILELEEKIFAGNLGCLAVKDRENWRNCLQNHLYQDLDKTITRRKNGEIAETDLEGYKDPGYYLEMMNGTHDNYDNNKEEAIHALAVALAQIAHSIEPKFLKKPLGKMWYGRRVGEFKKDNLLHQWEQSLLSSSSFSQIFLHYGTLDSCVLWSKSALVARCRICRRTNDSENMLLCDSCNWGHHLYCLKPKLKSVPSGDWFCDKCQEEKKKEDTPVPETPTKKRRIFKDEEDSEDTSSSDDEEIFEEENEHVEEEEEGQEEEDDISFSGKVCKTCRSGGELIECDKCCNTFHIECVEPPLRHSPRGPWTCTSCKKHKNKYDKNYNYGAVVQRTAILNGQRCCAAKALYKIHDFAKSLRQQSESDDSSEDEVVTRRCTRRDDGGIDFPLHNSALHEVLSEIMKDSNAWPFLRPVQKFEVPDYYDVITKPMDFGTIKYKLNMGEYTEDSQFMSDALLVFQNCNTYNHTEDDVYRCGVELLKHFQKKCRELGLKLPDEMDYYHDRNEDDKNNTEQPRKKIRTK